MPNAGNKPIPHNPGLLNSHLGKKIDTPQQYDPTVLFPIPRASQRKLLNTETLPFNYGADIWTAYEISWLNPQGKPQVAIGEFAIPHQSPNLIESKSLKLYLNSFNQSKFPDLATVNSIIQHDLSAVVGMKTKVHLSPTAKQRQPLTGICLDALDICCDTYQPNPDFLQLEANMASETLYSDLFKSNCPVTGQPDWASIIITYTGRQINHSSLLRYLISYRNHATLHEYCVENIFNDIFTITAPQNLTVAARFLRRGGIDINPWRSTNRAQLTHQATFRQ